MNVNVEALEPKTYRLIKYFIWLYFIFLMVEGALRKWILPFWSNYLILIRDPIVLGIYILYINVKGAPINNFIKFIGGIALISFILAQFIPSTHLLITLYGIKANYLHIPLIFIMAEVLTRADVYRFGYYMLLMSPFMTGLIIAQFHNAPSHFLNCLPGKEIGSGIPGALGRFRPPGIFSFVSVLGLFYSLSTAYLCALWVQRRPFSLIGFFLIGVSILIAIPFSISRILALSCLIVILTACYCIYYQPRRMELASKAISAGIIIVAIGLLLPFTGEGIKTFETRWNQTTLKEIGGVKKNIFGRILDSFLQPLTVINKVPLKGYGVGAGTKVGFHMTGGKSNLLVWDNEWGRILVELGPILGLFFIFYRLVLFSYIFWITFQQCRLGNALPLILFSAVGLFVINGHLGPATQAGFTFFGAGLALAACNPYKQNAMQRVAKRQLAHQIIDLSYIKKHL